MTATSKLLRESDQLIASVRGQTLTEEERISKAIALAALMAEEAKRIETKDERSRYAEFGELITDSQAKSFIVDLTDQCFRSSCNKRTADQLVFLIDKFGIPKHLSWMQRQQLKLFQWIGKPFASFLVPKVRKLVRKKTEGVIRTGPFADALKYVRMRTKQGVRVNINHLGETVLSEEEAKRRLELCLKDLESEDVEYISVKITTLYSQINLIAWDKTVEILAERLRALYRAAQQKTFKRPDGTLVPKFINLDMEEYKDFHLTVDVFKKVLDEPEFHQLYAGIVLQSYIPDSFPIQQQLTAWAMERVAAGGAPIKIRVVKGANLAMEQVESSIRSWPMTSYTNKLDVDANFKKMVQYGCRKELAEAVHLGIGSHNLFDIAYTFMLSAEMGVEDQVTFEMLEGMADPLCRVVRQLSGGIVIYCPITEEKDFENAVSYLMRRLDENTAPRNFLRHFFEMAPGTPQWQEQVQLFSEACEHVPEVGNAPQRMQNRRLEPQRPFPTPTFHNEPDTDFSIAENRKWGQQILQEGSKKTYPPIPLVIDGKMVHSKENQGIGD